MSTRIRKRLGYGLVDLKAKEGRIIDQRINNDCERFDYDMPSNQDYSEWLKDNSCDTQGNLDKWLFADGEANRRGRDLNDCIVWEGEFGLSNVMLFQPLATSDWSRNDDAIDYVEDTYLLDEPQQPRFELLENGLHPFSSSYMDKRTGERVPDSIMHWIRAKDFSEKLGVERLAVLAQEAGFESHDQALECVVPLVPTEIRDIVNFSKIFTADDVWLQLRPLLYVYWS